MRFLHHPFIGRLKHSDRSTILLYVILVLAYQPASATFHEWQRDPDHYTLNDADCLRHAAFQSVKPGDRLAALQGLSFIYRHADYDSCLKYCALLMELSRQENEPYGLAIAQFYMGVAKTNRQELPAALAHYQLAVNYSRQAGDSGVVRRSYNNIGIILVQKARYEESAEYFFKSLRLTRQDKDEKFIGYGLHNLGFVLFQLNKLDESLDYFSEALDIATRTQDPVDIAGSSLAIGNIHNKAGRYAEADKAYAIALEACPQERPDILLQVYGGSAKNFNALKQHERALALIAQSFDIVKQINDPYLLSMVYGTAAEIYLARKDWAKAKHALDSSRHYMLDVFYMMLGPENMGLYVDLYEGMGDYQQALFYHKKYAALNDSIFKIQANDKVTELQILYDTEKKQQELEQKQIELENQSLLNAQRTRQLLAIGVALIVSVLALILLIALLRKLNRQKLALERKDKENQLLMSEIHHRVKNNLQMISSLLNLQQRDISDTEAKKAISEGSGRVRSMALVHNLLYREDDHSTAIEMRDYVQRLADELVGNLQGEKPVRIEMNVPELKLDVDQAVPLGLILNELITNSLKYGQDAASPLIKIELAHKGDSLMMQYSDNGAGKTSDAARGDGGFGMRMIRSLTEQLRGNYTVDSEGGLRYEFHFSDIKTY